MLRRASCWLAVASALVLVGGDWPQFRGGSAGSVAKDADLPVKWNVKDGTNIAWTAELPGRGPASPVVFGDKVFVTASDGPDQDRLVVLAFDANSGAELWRRRFWATGRCLSHPQSANAAPTPACDASRVYAFFSSNDLACLDHDGNLLWFRGLAYDFPKAGNDVGMSASPLVIGDTVIVQVENQGDSFAMGINTATGETRWRESRPPEANWTSPTAWKQADGKELVLIQSTKYITAHDPATGKQVWKYEAECQGIPSPTAVGERIFVPAKGITELKASSDSSHVAVGWEANKLGPGAASPIVHGDRIYTINRAPVLTCAKLDDGAIAWQLRLKGSFWATPVIAGDRMYCVNFEGACQVIGLGAEKGESLAVNEFGEQIQASPAVAGNALYVRGDKHLWKVMGKQ